MGKRVPKEPGKKWCARHQRLLPLSEFGGHNAYCRECLRSYVRQKRKSVPRGDGSGYIRSSSLRAGPVENCYLDLAGAFRHRCGNQLRYVGSDKDEHEFRCEVCHESIVLPREALGRVERR